MTKLSRETVKAGDIITYEGSHGNVYSVRVTGVSDFRLSYEEGDGVRQFMEDTCFKNYDLKGYRYATDEEVAEFRRLFRPAPMNYLD